MAAAVVGAFGGLDVLCANSGIFPDAPLQTMTPDQLTEVLDVNAKGTVQRAGLSRRADRVRPGSHRADVVDHCPITGFPGWSHYGASKAARLGFMRTAGSNSPRTGSPSTG
jgi:3-oxoacyl-[acyl-carrier protein] reductase